MGADLRIRQGDTLPVFTQSITDQDGNPLDLTDCTVTFVMRAATAISPTVSAPATVTDATSGFVEYAWQPGDTAAAGVYSCTFGVTNGSGGTYTYPNDGYLEVAIEPNLTSIGGQTIVTLGEAKDHINILSTDKSEDAKLLGFIKGATPVIESICGPILVNRYEEWHDGGSYSITVWRRPSSGYEASPVFEVVAVSEYNGPIEWPEALVASPDLGQLYSVMPDPTFPGRIVRRTAGGGVQAFPYMPQSIHVVYLAGQSVVPDNVRQGTLDLIRIRFQRTQRGRGKGQANTDDNMPGTQVMGFFVPNEVREQMAPNRRFPALA